MGLLPLPEMSTLYSVGSTFSFDGDNIKAAATGDFVLEIDAADNNISVEDYIRPLTVTGVPKNVFALFLDVIACEGADSRSCSIGYFATHFDDTDGTSILVPGDLLEQDPRTWLCDGLRQELPDLGPETLCEEFSLKALAAYITK